MYTHEIKNLLLQNLNLEKVYVFVDRSHYKIIAIDKVFIGKNIREQHQLIYAPLVDFITCNKIHAISIHTFSPEEWHTQHRFYRM